MKKETFLRIYIPLKLLLLMATTAFSQQPAPQFDQPIEPDLYIIRPGDELVVTFLKANIEPLKLKVDPECQIVESRLGKFDLSHKTLKEARELLIKTLSSLYKVENIAISVATPLQVRVSVTGAVESPGFYQGFSSQRVSEAIRLAGGILKDGSTRRITFSGGPAELKADLDLANYSGNNDANPRLYAGFNIHVPQRSNYRIQIIGEVNEPREIELLESDDLQRLIALAGGFRSWADSSKIEIIRDGATYDAYVEPVQSGDIIKVHALSDIKEISDITLFGAVARTGRYKFSENFSLSQLIERAGGYDKRAVESRTTVFRLNPVDASGRISTQRFPIQNVYPDERNSSEFKLSKGDSVFVPYFVGFVEVAGFVSNPGIYAFQQDKTAEYYIKLAGGYLPESERTEIELFDSISRTTMLLSPRVTIQDGCKIIVGKRRDIK